MARDGLSLRAATRQELVGLPAGVEVVQGTDLRRDFDWRPALLRCEAVVHTAARVHLMRDSALEPLTEFRRVNVDGTLLLARQAAEAGVRRFVFLSSIKVNGERTQSRYPFTADDIPAPEDDYGRSKYEAEETLREVGATSGMEVVNIRPVLVYGPGVKANFLAMMRWVAQGIPLPFGGIQNRRSLVGLDNLVDLVSTCLTHPAAGNQTFLVSDGEDLSTSQLLQRTGMALNHPARLIQVPRALLEAGATLVGKRNVARRLLESLQVDISKTQRLLNWIPPMSVEEGLRSTAQWFLTTATRR